MPPTDKPADTPPMTLDQLLSQVDAEASYLLDGGKMPPGFAGHIVEMVAMVRKELQEAKAARKQLAIELVETEVKRTDAEAEVERLRNCDAEARYHAKENYKAQQQLAAATQRADAERARAMEQAAKIVDALMMHVTAGVTYQALEEDNPIPLVVLSRAKTIVTDTLAKASAEIRDLIPQPPAAAPDQEWLLRAAEREGNCIVSVGGLLAKDQPPAAPKLPCEVCSGDGWVYSTLPGTFQLKVDCPYCKPPAAPEGSPK